MNLRTLRAATAVAAAAMLAAACGGSTTPSAGGGTTAAAGSAVTSSSGPTADASTEPAPSSAGGGGAAPGGSTEGALTLWVDALFGDEMTKQAAAFSELNGVPMNVEVIAENLQTQFVTASQAGTGPDLVMGAHDWIGNLVQNGAIDPIPLPDATVSEFSELAIEGVTFDGQIYGVPFAVENVVLYRNTDLAPDAPATIEELIAKSEELKAAGSVTELLALPVGQQGDAYHIYPFYRSAGGYLFGQNADGSYNPDDFGLAKPEASAAMAKIGALGETGSGALKTSIGSDNLVQVFTDKQAAFMVSGPWNLPSIQKAGINYDISPVPGFEGADEAIPFVGVQALYVAAKGKNKALAEEFATNFFTTPEVARAIYDVQPRPPALTAVFDEVSAENPDIAKFSEAGANGEVMPSITAMAAVFDPLGKAEAAIVTGADPAATVQQAATAIQAAIGG